MTHHNPHDDRVAEFAPKRRRRWPRILGYIALAFAAVMLLAAIFADTDEPTVIPAPADTRTEADTPTDEAQAAPDEPVGHEPEPENLLEDDGWVIVGMDVSEDGLGDYEGTARMTNQTGSRVESAMFTVTLLSGGDVVATMLGATSGVDAGETVTVQFITSDDYVTSDFTAELQVDASF